MSIDSLVHTAVDGCSYCTQTVRLVYAEVCGSEATEEGSVIIWIMIELTDLDLGSLDYLWMSQHNRRIKGNQQVEFGWGKPAQGSQLRAQLHCYSSAEILSQDSM